jgi:hypothetical protein
VDRSSQGRYRADRKQGRSYPGNNFAHEDMSDRKFGDQLGRFYERVVSSIRDADSILIFGPGEAKVELDNLLKKEGLGGCIVAIETVDKLTNPQIAANVRAHFLNENK